MDGLVIFFRDSFSKVIHWFKRFQFGNKAQLAFLEDFYLLVNDGVPPNRAIEMLAHVTRGITRDVATSLAQKISQGQPLAEGMREWFNVSIVEIIRVGEEGGTLNETVKSAINTVSTQSGLIGAFIGAISYPFFVIAIACAIVVYLNTSVFTQFRAVKPENQWPEAGQELVMLAHIIEDWWWVVILITIAIIFIMRRIFSNYVGAFRGLLDKIPPFTLYRRFVAARLLETLGLLVANGVVFKQALKIMQYYATPYLTSHLIQMENLMSMGKVNIADVLETGLISDEDLLRLRVMAEVKGFEHGLVRMGIRGSEQVAKTMKLISKVIGGLLMTIGGLMIVVIIRGIYLTGMAMGA